MVTLMFGAGMPGLYLVMFFQLFFMYWFDKFCCKQQTLTRHLVVRIYKTPPRYGIDMSRTTRTIMQYAILFHVVISFFMYSNTAIFSDDDVMSSP